MEQPKEQQPQQQASSGMTAGAIASIVISVIIGFLAYYGAAKLSYDRYGSVGWAILAFIFAPFYYPYYAYFVSTPVSSSIFGGRRLMRK